MNLVINDEVVIFISGAEKWGGGGGGGGGPCSYYKIIATYIYIYSSVIILGVCKECSSKNNH